jgi:hypothetical protein
LNPAAGRRFGAWSSTKELKEIAMLMPILTARTQAQTTPVVPVEAIQPRDRLQALTVSVSGPRAEAILKILETLGRHLNGSEVLPKEALVRLMETLARILKFPPLPQETSHDFGRRLASILEKLPPEARVVLEKQLGQRNLALQVRLLAEVLQNPAGSDTGRMRATLQNPASLGSPSRDTGQQVRAPLPQPGLPAQHLATLTAGSAPTAFAAPAEAALLQAVLRKTFGPEASTDVSEAAVSESDTETVTVPKRQGESIIKTGQTQQATNTTAARPATTEPMPQLRATAAFLAADPEALSLVSAIAQGEIDPQVEMAFASRPDDKTPAGPTHEGSGIEADGVFAADTSAETLIGMVEQPEITADADPSISAGDVLEQSPAEQSAAEPVEADQQAPASRSTDQAQDAPLDDRSVPDETPARQSDEQRRDEKQATATDRQSEKPVRMLAETLKALVQSTLPLPEGTPLEMASLSDVVGRKAPVPQSVALPGLEAMLDAATTQVEAGWTAELADKIDSWVAQADAGPEEIADGHTAWTPQPKADEAIRDPLVQHRLLEGMAGREAIPFAIIPYLPAKSEDGLFTEPAEEQQAATEDEEQGDQTQDEDQPDRRDEEQAGPSLEQETTASDNEESAQDPYALYMRMGGLA